MSEHNLNPEDLAALHALNLLDEAGERELFQAVNRDPAVQPLVHEFAESAAMLVYDAPPLSPPAGVKREIMRQLPTRGGGSNILPFTSWIPYAIAAGLMVLGIYQVLRISHLRSELAASQATIQKWQWQVSEEAEREGMAHFHVVPLDTKDPSYGATRLFVTWNSRLHQGRVTSQNLPAPPTGHDYQLWVLDPHQPAPVSAGVLPATDTSHDFAVQPVATEGPGFAVSLEPSGGSPSPTGPILFAVAPME